MNNLKKINNWMPKTPINVLKKRAEMNTMIRSFFTEKKVLEVETPILSRGGGTHPEMSIFDTTYNTSNNNSSTYYLQSSPESFMKRLIANGSGDIFQICKAFRKEEADNNHNPEFTILEWYRLGMDYKELIEEVDQLLQFILSTPKAKKYSYAHLFDKYLNINPHNISLVELKPIIKDIDIKIDNEINNKISILDKLLDWILGQQGKEFPIVVFDFPDSQSCQAQIREGDYPVAERFEFYVNGLELANGYQELTDPKELIRRHNNDNSERIKLGYPKLPQDKFLIQALEEGLPMCSGVAIGIDRLLMCHLNSQEISDVIPFPIYNS
jgi:lysyl-tRNA synthetase class 2